MASVYDPAYPDSVQVFCILTGTNSLHDLSEHVVSPIHGEYGMAGSDYLDLVAVPGLAEFHLNNLDGRYLFGTSDTLAGWKKGIRFYVVVNYFGIPTYVFSAFLDDTEVDEPIYGLPTVKVTLSDWMQKASNFKLRKMQVLTDSKIGVGVDAIVDTMPVPPADTSYDDGTDTFPTLFDGTKAGDVAITEFQRLALSEFAPIYLRMKKRGTVGEQLRAESRGTRTSSLAYARLPDNYTFLGDEWGGLICADQGLSPLLIDTVSSAGTLEALSADIDSGDNILNEIACRAYPSGLLDKFCTELIQACC
jgi:hypothetical protein